MDAGGFPADTGDNAACFGVVNSANQRLFQRIALPEGTAQVRLTGRRCFVTTEPQDAANDTLTIELRDPDTAQPVAVLATLSNLDADTACIWEDLQLTANIDQSADQPLEAVDFYMEGRLDAVEITTFFLDTFAIEAFACLPE